MLEPVGHGEGIGGSENSVTDYKNINTCFFEGCKIVFSDTSVDLDKGSGTGLVDHFTKLADLFIRVLDENLGSESGIYGHDKHEVEVVEDILKY